MRERSTLQHIPNVDEKNETCQNSTQKLVRLRMLLAEILQ